MDDMALWSHGGRRALTQGRAAWLLVVSALLAGTACQGPARPTGGQAAQPGPAGRSYLVVADHPEAAACGMHVLGAGGNAADAAVAVSFALAVVRPEACGVGGGGCALYCAPGQAVAALDFREQAPAAVGPRDYLDREGAPIPGRATVGPWAAAVPGQVRGALDVWRRFGSGRLTLEEVLAPAILLAQDGVRVDHRLHEAMGKLADVYRAYPDYRQRFAETYRTLLKPGGIPYAEGEVLRRPELASTLLKIAKNGADAFYRGEVGTAIVREVGRLGGVLASADLTEYRVRETEPLRADLFGCRVYAPPPPSAGGAVALEALSVLAAAEERGGGEFRPHLLAEALKLSLGDRELLANDREWVASARQMISPSHAAEVLRRIDAERAAAARALREASAERCSTTHFCVCDAEGGVASWSESMGAPFGSLVTVPGTGVLLNGAMADFAVRAGGGGAGEGAPRPGARPLHGMTPIVVFDADGFRLAVGASGGARAVSAVLAVLVRTLADGEALEDAVGEGRLHWQWNADVLLLEPQLPPETVEGLLARGHTLRAYGKEEAGCVQAIEMRARALRGVVDPRGE